MYAGHPLVVTRCSLLATGERWFISRSSGGVPGLSEMMSLQQIRHVKLWFAGQTDNWDLAAYEIAELGEGFDDVSHFIRRTKIHPWRRRTRYRRRSLSRSRNFALQSTKRTLTRLSRRTTPSPPLVTTAIKRRHCGFNRVQRPAMNPYPNQVFSRAPQ